MDQNLDFRFSVPRSLDGPLVELTPEEAERMLLKGVEEEAENPIQAMWRLAQYYKLQKRHD